LEGFFIRVDAEVTSAPDLQEVYFSFRVGFKKYAVAVIADNHTDF
jgi:hypothetical protein